MKFNIVVSAICLSSVSWVSCHRGEEAVPAPLPLEGVARAAIPAVPGVTPGVPAVVAVAKPGPMTMAPPERGRHHAAPMPLPTIELEPKDLSSGLGSGPIKVKVNNWGRPVGEDVLKALAREVHLYGQDTKSEVRVAATIRDVPPRADHAPNGYPVTPMAEIEIQPKKPLGDGWYTLRVHAVPEGLAKPRFGSRQTLPDGSIGARLSTASHPRPASVRVCDKEGGEKVVIVDWSEPVVYPQDPTTMATLQETSGGSTCLHDPAQRAVGSTSAVRFLCQNVPQSGARFMLGLDRRVTGKSGGAMDLPTDRTTGKAHTDVAVDSLEAEGEGCRIHRPW
jgi:hypothetical protein